MANNPVTMARRHVLGDLNYRCEPVQNVPVFLDDTDGETLGFVDESLGKYADAITFHLEDDPCKKLATGQFTYSFEYDYADDTDTASPSKRRIKLSSITLISRKGYEKPLPRRAAAANGKAAEAAS
ncbi:MAG: hypothetical protein IPM25_04985 [Chloracidobacterium sp.]|nr:hypothetical protein [Chloracidobacterium sp.]